MHEQTSLTGKTWILAPQISDRKPHTMLRDLLLQRELDTVTQHATDVLFPQMGMACERINRAMRDGESIAIFGDYDCDGVTATAQLVRFVRRRGREPFVRLPHRVRDGYGLRESIVQEFISRGINLLITVDTGIASINEIALLKQHGIDVIVTDHHQAREELPMADAILHPVASRSFPTPHPAGAGVAFALVEALENGAWDDRDADCVLAMIGTVADLVELKGSNRRLVQRGLQSLERLSTGPLAELRDRTGAQTSTDIAFRIAPRLNAAGRMDDPHLALSALLDGGAALEHLDRLNEERQGITKTLCSDVVASMQGTETALLWAASEAYPPGIIGLIAGKLTELYGRPSCIVHVEGDQCIASLRSPACYHLAEGLQRGSHLFSAYGGHAMAAGCSFARSDADRVREHLEDDVRSRTNPQMLLPTLAIDGVLSPHDLTFAFARDLQELEPYGQGNTEPLFLLSNVRMESPRAVGLEGDHLQGRIGGMKVIGFRLGCLASQTSEALDVLCRIRLDTWNGKQELQLVIDDMRVAKTAPVPKK